MNDINNNDDSQDGDGNEYDEEVNEEMEREQLERFLHSDDRQSRRGTLLRSEIMKSLDFSKPTTKSKAQSQKLKKQPKKRGFLDSNPSSSASSSSKRRSIERGDGNEMSVADIDEDESSKDSASSNAEDSNVGGGQQQEQQAQSLFLEDVNNVIFLTHTEASAMMGSHCLQELNPNYIVLYDSDIEFIRWIEIYSAQTNNYYLNKVFMLSYGMFVYDLLLDACLTLISFRFVLVISEGSTEEHRYIAKLTREKKAFESLISIKAEMVICLPDFAEDLLKEKKEDMTLSMDTRTRSLTPQSSLGAASSSSSSSTAAGIKKMQSQNRSLDVVVDVREFRSSLPSLLHAQGFKIVPRTLQVPASLVLKQAYL
jgi:DNA excision repair protein ERCC-4